MSDFENDRAARIVDVRLVDSEAHALTDPRDGGDVEWEARVTIESGAWLPPGGAGGEVQRLEWQVRGIYQAQARGVSWNAALQEAFHLALSRAVDGTPTKTELRAKARQERRAGEWQQRSRDSR